MGAVRGDELEVVAWTRLWSEGLSWFAGEAFSSLPVGPEPGLFGLWTLEALAAQRVLVLTGEGGLGKTGAVHAEVRRLEAAGLGALWIDLKEFDSQSQLMPWLADRVDHALARAEGCTIFVDAIDESARLSPPQLARVLADVLSAPARQAHCSLRLVGRPHMREELLDAAKLVADALLPKPAIRTLELLPLTQADLRLAAETWGLRRVDAFCRQVSTPAFAPLAARPITLGLLAGQYIRTHSIEGDRAAVYREGLRELLRPSRGDRDAMSADRALATAKTLAVVSLLSGRPVIRAPSGRGPVQNNQLDPLACFEDGAPEGSPPLADVETLLGTRLFRQAEQERDSLTWNHASFAEHLAAQRLADLEDDDAVMALLSQRTPDGQRVVSSLRRLAGWVASLRPGFAGLLRQTDLLTLLSADPDVLVELSDVDKEAVVTTLLAQIEGSAGIPEVRPESARALQYDGLGARLREALARAGQNRRVRAQLARFVGVFGQLATREELLRWALDDGEHISVRARAIRALRDVAREEDQLRLLDLLGAPQRDPTDDLKGALLELLSRLAHPRGLLSPAETWRRLPRRESGPSVNAFTGFVARYMEPSLEHADEETLLSALSWCTSGGEWGFPELMDAVFQRAWMDVARSERVRLGLCRALVPWVGRWELPERLLAECLVEGDGTQTRRRLLVATLVPLAVRSDASVLGNVSTVGAFCRPSDAGWLLERLKDRAPEPKVREAWARVVSYQASRNRMGGQAWRGHIDALWEADDPAVVKVFRNWKGPTEQEMARAAEWERERARIAEVADAATHEAIANLEAFLEPDASPAWPELCGRLERWRQRLRTVRERQRAPEVLWAAQGAAKRDCVTASAKAWLEKDATRTDEGDSKRDWLSGRALGFLWDVDRPWVEERLAGNWSRWLQGVRSSEEASGAVQAVVDAGAQHDPGGLYLQLLNGLLNGLCRGGVDRMLKASEHLLRQDQGFALWLLALDRARTLDIWAARILFRRAAIQWGEVLGEPLIQLVLCDDDGLSEDTRIAAAESALRVCDDPQWRRLASWVLSSAPRALAVFVPWPHSNDQPRANTAFLAKLQADALVSLLDALLRLFPTDPHTDEPIVPAEDWGLEGWDLSDFRSCLLDTLCSRFPDVAATHLSGLAIRYPGEVWLPAAAQRVRAVEVEVVERWPAPRQVLELLHNTERRWVRDVRELCDLVVEQLSGMDRDMRGSRQVLWEVFWNHPDDPKRRQPKKENKLSDHLRDRLRDRLKGRQLALNREVEIQPSVAKGTGARPDLLVEAFAPGRPRGDAESWSLPIEVKAIWHGELETAMKAQLVDRYMSGPGVRAGVYVVFWFPPGQSGGKAAQVKASFWSLEATRAFFDRQAQELCDRQRYVRAVVLDASPPQPPRDVV